MENNSKTEKFKHFKNAQIEKHSYSVDRKIGLS